MKYKIQYVKNKLKGGYIGMNAEAAKQLNIPFKHKSPQHTLVIYNGVSKAIQKTTINHEKAERYFVSILNMRRKKSHYNALRFENLGIPFPSTNIKSKLKEVNFKIK
jgi:hypothetical protein